ncbi:hypothetical protein LXL04_023281 [Taraxacum kok-saghyz]
MMKIEGVKMKAEEKFVRSFKGETPVPLPTLKQSEMEEQRQPSSSETSTFQVNNTIETLLKFTLTLSIEESLDIGLSKEFCSSLLKEDEYDHTYPSSTSTTDISEGVPAYPLYKHLASALCRSISLGAIHTPNANIPLIHDDSSMNQKMIEWNKIILEKGSDLIQMLETVEFGLHVQEPFFTQIKDGKKTIEGRCASGDYNRIESGSLILLNKCLMLQVHDVHYYGSFYDMLATEDLTKVLPGVESIKEGVQIYRRFYSEEKERSNGVLAIFLTKPTSQLYDHMAVILKALHYDGVQRLLRMSHTVGTIPDALPLPKSTLLSAFSSPHNPNVKSSILSDGARALAKHVNRSNGKFWGSFAGNESHKNMLAVNAINHLVAHCCWMNVHTIPPHGAVFEIRVYDGYGARWALNPPKVSHNTFTIINITIKIHGLRDFI